MTDITDPEWDKPFKVHGTHDDGPPQPTIRFNTRRTPFLMSGWSCHIECAL